MKAALVIMLVVPQGMAKTVPEWFSSVKDKARKAVTDSSDLVKVADILRDNPLVVKSCGDANHAMQVEDIVFDHTSLKLTARGTLTREVTAGKIMAATTLGDAAKGMSLKDKFLRKASFSVFGHHSTSEPLCNHFSRTSQMTCPLARGAQELSFAFKNLPPVVSAGTYNLKVVAVDQMENPVACLHGHLSVPLGPNGEKYRRLESEPVKVSSAPRCFIGFWIVAAMMVFARQ